MATLLQIPAAIFSPLQDGNISRFCGPNLKPKRPIYSRLKVRAVKEEIKNPSSAEEITQKFGLEAGLWKIFSSKEGNEEAKESKSKGDQAKELLAKYGGAYLATSITPLPDIFWSMLCSNHCWSRCTIIVAKVGISTNETGEKVGTFALAYAAHKAASPIRFPPTVALTPIVASWIGKKADQEK